LCGCGFREEKRNLVDKTKSDVIMRIRLIIFQYNDETSRMWKKTEKGVAGWKLPLTEAFENYL